MNPIAASSFDDGYRQTWDYLLNPEKYSREEWVRRYGEPITQSDIDACEAFISSQQPKKEGCNIL